MHVINEFQLHATTSSDLVIFAHDPLHFRADPSSNHPVITGKHVLPKCLPPPSRSRHRQQSMFHLLQAVEQCAHHTRQQSTRPHFLFFGLSRSSELLNGEKIILHKFKEKMDIS